MTTDPLREAAAQLLLVVDGWQAEGLGTCPQIARTNYPDAWTDVLAAAATARAALAATAPADGPDERAYVCRHGKTLSENGHWCDEQQAHMRNPDGCTCTISTETQTIADDCPMHHIEPYMAAAVAAPPREDERVEALAEVLTAHRLTADGSTYLHCAADGWVAPYVGQYGGGAPWLRHLADALLADPRIRITLTTETP